MPATPIDPNSMYNTLGSWAAPGGMSINLGGGSGGSSGSAPSMSIPGLQKTIATAFTGPLNQFDPGWQARAKQSGMTSEAISSLVSSFAAGGDATKIFGEGLARSQKAGGLIDDLLAGKISQADQAGLSQRSAENAQNLGMWGGAKGGAARGLEARDLGMTQHSLQMMGLAQAGHANDALLGAMGAISGASSLGNQANQDSLAMQLAKGGIGLATDWMGMNMQMQAGNLNAAARFNAGKMLQGGGAEAGGLAPKTLGGGSLVDQFNKAFGGDNGAAPRELDWTQTDSYWQDAGFDSAEEGMYYNSDPGAWDVPSDPTGAVFSNDAGEYDE